MKSSGLWIAACLVGSGCHKTDLNQSTAALTFSCPSQPGALTSQAQSVTLDFGDLPLGAMTTLTLDLSSLSSSGVTIANVQPVQASSSLNFPLNEGTTVEPSPPTIVQATFAPISVGAQIASWKIELVSGSAVTVTLEGYGFGVDLSVVPDPVDFGNVEIHGKAMLPVTVTNNSSRPVDLVLLPSDAGVFTVGPLPSGEGYLAVGASLTFNAAYSPPQLETDSSSFSLLSCQSCSQGSSGVQVPLKGTGVLSTLSFPNPLKFGFVDPGTSVQKVLALQNMGNTSLQILAPPVLYSGAAVPSPAEAAVYTFAKGVPSISYPYIIPGGAELDLPIVFTPPQIGAYLDATVSFQSSDPTVLGTIVELQGYGGGARISCQPQSLDLGSVVVGFSSAQSLICLNAGTDVPGHPEAALQLSQAQLGSSNSDFVVLLESGTDAGPIDGGLSLSLPAGQSAGVEVTFKPRDAGAKTGTLLIGSNDVAHDPLNVPLTGRGVIPGPCTALVLPASGLNFGEVPKGGSAILQFEIENLGSSYCVVQNFSLAVGTDPGYSLLGSPIAPQFLSFPGDPDNSTQVPTSLRIPIQFLPQQSENTAQGSVDFQITTAQPENQSVSLTGSSAAACLTFVPARSDFGLVSYDAATHNLCFNPKMKMAVQNSCQTQVTIESIQLQSNLDNPAQFGLQGLPPLPAQLPAGGQLNFSVMFEATSLGPKVETVQVITDEFSTPYSLSLTGDSEAAGFRTDTFTVPQKLVDLVLILDDDDDYSDPTPSAPIYPPAAQFRTELPLLLAGANAAQLDYRIAVTTTSTCFGGDQGAFLPCSYCTDDEGIDPIYVTPQSKPNSAAVLDQIIVTSWPKGLCNDLDEQMFEAPFQALDPSLINDGGHNSNFLRQDAYLVILTMNSDPEDDKTILTPIGVATFLQGLKPNDDSNLVSWSYVSPGDQSEPRVSQLANATGGIVIQMDDKNWESQFLGIFSSTLDLGVFRLGAQPNVTSLQVAVNGMPLDATDSQGNANWSYDPIRNAVVFPPSVVPSPGSLVTVTYSVSCA